VTATARTVPGTGISDVSGVVADHVRQVPDFPRPGILFRDLTPLFADGPAFRAVVDAIVAHHGPFDEVAGIEARGFLIAAAVGYATGAGVVPIRKAGKLPGETLTVDYALEYGNATLEVHTDAFAPGARVLLVDDVLATGGTAAAAAALVERAGATVIGLSVLMELADLDGRDALGDLPVDALLTVR
jgi:adenine phosphoribosyltransferase